MDPHPTRVLTYYMYTCYMYMYRLHKLQNVVWQNIKICSVGYRLHKTCFTDYMYSAYIFILYVSQDMSTMNSNIMHL